MTANIRWTNACVESLKRGLADGLTCAQIAERVRAECGVAYGRNAVIGKVNRMGLKTANRREGERKRPRKARTVTSALTDLPVTIPANGNADHSMQRRLKAAAKAAPLHDGIENDAVFELPPEVVTESAVTLLELRAHHCRWPIGEPGALEFRFCGVAKPEDERCPYCVAHSRIAYTASSWPRPRPYQSHSRA